MKKDVKAAVSAAMEKAGFTEDAEHPIYSQVDALSENGDFVVHGAWSKDDVRAHLEQNTAPTEPGSDTLTVYPPVLVVENSKGGRVAVNTNDLEAMASVLAGTTEF